MTVLIDVPVPASLWSSFCYYTLFFFCSRYFSIFSVQRNSGSLAVWWFTLDLSRIHKGDHDVTRSCSHFEALVIVRESPGMHQHPTGFRIGDRAVVPDKSASTTLVVDPCSIQGDVDGVGRGIMMRPQRRLLVRSVSHDEIHQRPRWLSRDKIATIKTIWNLLNARL